MEKIKVFIADDHVMVRQGIKKLLELEGNIEVIGQAGDGESALAQIKELKPQIVLLDLNMPVLDGVNVIKMIKQQNVDTKIIVLTIHDELEYLIKTANEGADGYILKGSDMEVLFEAIKAVKNGETYIQSNLASQLIKKLNKSEEEDSDKNKIRSLSKREIQVLIFITQGLSNKDIAEKLNISEKTVKNHVSNMFKKIKVNDRVQATVFAIKNSIIDLKKE